MHCHRCKAAVLPGETIVRYNKPLPGTVYHRTCPNGAVAESQASAPKVVAPAPAPFATQVPWAGPLTPEAMTSIIASVTALLQTQQAAQAAQAAPAPAPAPAPPAPTTPVIPEPVASATTDDDDEDTVEVCNCCGSEVEPGQGGCCGYHEHLVFKGYERMGFDCPAHGWFPARTLQDAQEALLDALDRYSDRNGTSPLLTSGNRAAWDDLFTDAAEGLGPKDLKRLLDWHQGVAAGVRAANEYRTDQHRRARRNATGPDAARNRRAGSHGKDAGRVPLTLLVDDEQAAQADATYHADLARAAKVAATEAATTATDQTPAEPAEE